ncbi:DUF2982 domain-containing protein [Thalassotalea sp. G2M2-11]|uniref:DUF2982 domain-containing protein n=1 Tax=Thalassotalea sp. G2M2-11 TaxID=2787627 RepID=UPI0019D20ECB|nr:DUF2982 domain-containing protein [Thalassotalea sp. G2M2-11]
MPAPVIYIKPKAKHNALFIILVSVCALGVILLLGQHYWQQAKFSLLLLLLLALSTLFLGVMKLLEPNTSFTLSPQHIRFTHRKGSWQLSWDDIRAIHPISNTYGITQEQLSYIGLTLHSLEGLKDQISLRLANHLIHEQKPLMVYCVSRDLMPAEQAVLNFEPYTCQDGSQIKGPLAGFFHQCTALYQAIGAHLFINDSAIDRDVQDFARLLTQCKQASPNYQENTKQSE